MMRGILLLLLLAGLGTPHARGETPELFPFVLPWDDASESVANLGGWQEKPAGRNGFVTVRDGHLYTGGKRIRFLGVNLCFGAAFPTHADSEKIAARMAKFGINCVRFHHMDPRPAPDGIFRPDLRTLDPVQMDKLDYLIAQLKAQGIYVNLNLHVSREYPGLPKWPQMPHYFKGIDHFCPEMIALQKEYARDLLTHYNPYTKTRYADEPAVAFIEINNENGLIQQWWNRGLDEMPARYVAELEARWNRWLANRYSSTEALKSAWGEEEAPQRSELLPNGRFARGMEGWQLQEIGSARAVADLIEEGSSRALRISVKNPGEMNWHVQLIAAGLSLRRNQTYELSFRAKADSARRIGLNAMQTAEPWKNLWYADAALSDQWQDFRFYLTPAEDEARARITFTGMAQQGGVYTFADVSLTPVRRVGLPEGESLGSVRMLRKNGYDARSEAVRRDWMRFLWETEESYWNEMARFIKKDLKAHGLVIGTQVTNSPFPIQAQLDVVDFHSYWQHPHFPGKPWDGNEWTVQNIPMAGRSDGGTLSGISFGRVAGKPFVVTEYNHSAPNTYSSEAFLLLAAQAALQDWDGIFAFSYSHRRDNWDLRRIGSYFDIDQHPAKMVTLPIAAALFRRGDVRTTPSLREIPADPEAVFESICRSGLRPAAEIFGLDRTLALRGAVALKLEGKRPAGTEKAPAGPPIASQTGEIVWDATRTPGVVTISTPRSKAVIGNTKSGPFILGEVAVLPGENRQNWAAIAMTVMEGQSFASAGRILLIAVGDTENTGMVWKSPEKNSVGTKWGTAPSLVEGIPATITLPHPAGRVRAWALDERGRRREPVPVNASDGKSSIQISPQYKTLWYELEIL